MFNDIAAITKWLDDSNPSGPHEDSMRIMKLAEEIGEVTAAYIGMVGQNPRKGITHNLKDVLLELADVAITALCAIQHFTQEESVTEKYLREKLDSIIHRANITVE